MRRLAALALAAVLGAATPAAQAAGPGLVDATDPEALRAIAERFGAARLDVDDYGDPIILGMMRGTYYAVEFYGCDNGRSCRELLFRAWFETRELTELEMAGWNRNAHFGRSTSTPTATRRSRWT